MKNNDQHKFSPEQLGAYYDGQLGESELHEIEWHAKTCPRCQAFLADLALMDKAVDKAECVSAPDGYFQTFGSAVANRIAREKLAPGKQARRFNWGWVTAAAALASLAIVLISGDLSKPHLYLPVPEEQKSAMPEAPARPEPIVAPETKSLALSQKAKSAEVPPQLDLAQAPAEMAAKDEAPAKRAKEIEVSGNSMAEKADRSMGSGLVSAPAPTSVAAPAPVPARAPVRAPLSIAPAHDRPAAVDNVTVIVICLPDGQKDCPEPKVSSAIRISLDGI